MTSKTLSSINLLLLAQFLFATFQWQWYILWLLQPMMKPEIHLHQHWYEPYDSVPISRYCYQPTLLNHLSLTFYLAWPSVHFAKNFITFPTWNLLVDALSISNITMVVVNAILNTQITKALSFKPSAFFFLIAVELSSSNGSQCIQK